MKLTYSTHLLICTNLEEVTIFMYLSKQNDHIASQPIRLQFKFSAAFGVADHIAYALVLTPKLISISSDGQRHFDLISETNLIYYL